MNGDLLTYFWGSGVCCPLFPYLRDMNNSWYTTEPFYLFFFVHRIGIEPMSLFKQYRLKVCCIIHSANGASDGVPREFRNLDLYFKRVQLYLWAMGTNILIMPHHQKHLGVNEALHLLFLSFYALKLLHMRLSSIIHYFVQEYFSLGLMLIFFFLFL